MIAKRTKLNLSSLKNQVYEYFRYQLKMGEIKPASLIDINAISKKLGVSRTPLRDALIQLEMEGFVTILPRRGVIVNVLTLQDIKDIYQIIGALESTAIIAAFDSLKESHIKKMQKLNDEMKKALERDNFDSYYERNLNFHDIYLRLSGNKMLRKTADTLKKRLYDFPRRVGYIKEWEEASTLEHQQLIDFLAERKLQEAVNFIRDVHWSYEVQEKYIRKYYSPPK